MTTAMAQSAFLVALAWCGFLAIRLYPLWPYRNRGCDAYYFMMCAEALRGKWRLPIRLPLRYVAELREQWYPPGFPVLLALLPPRWLKANHWMLNHILDSVVAVMMFILIRPVAGDLPAAGTVALYALQPAIIQEFVSLTSRPLGMILQLAVLIAGFLATSQGSWLAGAAAVLAMVLLIYSHKLSLQLLWFLLPFLTLVTGHWAWVGVLIIAYAVAALMAPSFFIKIQRAHLDITEFWSRNWRLLGAHPVRQSPIYGDGKTHTEYYNSTGMGSPFRFFYQVFRMNVFVIFLPFAFGVPGNLVRFCAWWTLGIYLWVLATYAVPKLRCLGLAQQYVKFAYVPVFACVACYLSTEGTFWAWLLCAACTAIVVRSYLLASRSMRHGALPPSDQLSDLTAKIDQLQNARLMVFPYHLYDQVAYLTGAQVLWGTHGYGFRRVESFFPVLTESLATILARFRVSHLVVDTSFVEPEELQITRAQASEEIGRFLVFDAHKLVCELRASAAQ